MYSSRLNSILEKIDVNCDKAQGILERIEKIYKAKCINDEGMVYLGKLKYRIETSIQKLKLMRQNLTKNTYSDESHLFYYEKEIDDMEVYLSSLDVK